MASEEPRERECPACGHSPVDAEVRSVPFAYGVGKDAIELAATVPLYSCTACGTHFLDRIGEQRQHEAVCVHRGVLTPAEIRAMRKQHGMTRAEFARATAIGEATLARWERGSVIQNEAYDRYLRLLQDPSTFRRVREMAGEDAVARAARAPRVDSQAWARNTEKRFRYVRAESFTSVELGYNPIRRAG